MPMTEPAPRFSPDGTYATSAFQPVGCLPRCRPLPLPRPSAGGYSSRSKPFLVGMSCSSRSRRRRALAVDDEDPRPAVGYGAAGGGEDVGVPGLREADLDDPGVLAAGVLAAAPPRGPTSWLTA